MPDPATSGVAEATYALARRLAEGRAKDEDVAEPYESFDELSRRDFRQDIGLKRSYAKWLLGFLGVQMVVTNVIFGVVAGAGMDWRVPDGVMIAWLSSTVVELIGVVAIVTRYLFSPRAGAINGSTL